jgi:glycyl-tRNA synthetase
MTEPAEKQTPSLNDKPLMERLVALCKRRGFIFQASEIYGGMNGVYDYGPLGAALKKNIKDTWWKDMVECPPDGPDGHPLQMVGLDSAILQLRQVWDAVGHTANFNDQMVDCRETKLRYRADHLNFYPVDIVEDSGVSTRVYFISVVHSEDAYETALKKFKKIKSDIYEREKAEGITVKEISVPKEVPYDYRYVFQEVRDGRQNTYAPDFDKPGTLTEPRAFNLMFQTYVGALQNPDNIAFLRPETCQGIFTNFKNVLDTSRVKVPFGIAQIGKAFRNEVTPRNFTFRSREFEQMEIEFFCHPDSAREWFEYWVATRVAWWEKYGLSGKNLYKHEISAEERAFYSQGTFDIEYQFPFTAPGFGELEGVAHRGNYDLTKHVEGSKQKLNYFDAETNQNYLPDVIEPSAGVDRGALALLCEGYRVDESRPSPEWLQIDPRLAPVKLGIFPLVNKDGMPEKAEAIYKDLRRDYVCQYDAKQSIGKRYARMDECGTPFCITVDGETLASDKVTVRNRDTATQETVATSQLRGYLAEKFKA